MDSVEVRLFQPPEFPLPCIRGGETETFYHYGIKEFITIYMCQKGGETHKSKAEFLRMQEIRATRPDFSKGSSTVEFLSNSERSRFDSCPFDQSVKAYDDNTIISILRIPTGINPT